jgi:hypothetical protein
MMLKDIGSLAARQEEKTVRLLSALPLPMMWEPWQPSIGSGGNL